MVPGLDKEEVSQERGERERNVGTGCTNSCKKELESVAKALVSVK